MVNYKAKGTKDEYIPLVDQYQLLYYNFLECADDDEIQKFYAYPFMNLLQYVRDQQRYYEKLKIEASKQALIAEKITEQQIIEVLTNQIIYKLF